MDLLHQNLKFIKTLSFQIPLAIQFQKGGIIQLTKWLAAYLAPNVRVNCLSQGV